MNFVFFGTDDISVSALNAMSDKGMKASLVVTVPDRKQGRGLKSKPVPVKEWADEKGVEVLQAESLRDEKIIDKLREFEENLFVVAGYGKIIPKAILDIPKNSVINIHPSLLPKYRGPSPVRTPILLDDKEVGVTIMKMDEGLDTGDILVSQKYEIDEWTRADFLEKELFKIGGELIAGMADDFVAGKIKGVPQDDSKASETKKIEKSDAKIDLADDPYLNFRKIQAYSGSPRAYFFQDVSGKKVRIIITKAEFLDNKLIIKRVIPEGGKERDFTN